MSAGQPGQVELPELLFGMSWEDPESDRQALQIRPGDALITIGSGGCNTFSLLLENPGRIFAVDINPCQSHLLELKRAADPASGLRRSPRISGTEPVDQARGGFRIACRRPQRPGPGLLARPSRGSPIRRCLSGPVRKVPSLLSRFVASDAGAQADRRPLPLPITGRAARLFRPRLEHSAMADALSPVVQ